MPLEYFSALLPPQTKYGSVVRINLTTPEILDAVDLTGATPGGFITFCNDLVATAD